MFRTYIFVYPFKKNGKINIYIKYSRIILFMYNMIARFSGDKSDFIHLNNKSLIYLILGFNFLYYLLFQYLIKYHFNKIAHVNKIDRLHSIWYW